MAHFTRSCSNSQSARFSGVMKLQTTFNIWNKNASFSHRAGTNKSAACGFLCELLEVKRAKDQTNTSNIIKTRNAGRISAFVIFEVSSGSERVQLVIQLLN